MSSSEIICTFVVKETTSALRTEQYQLTNYSSVAVMEIKKSAKADLEKGKGLSILLGLLVALSLVFVSLEWRSSVAQAQGGEGGDKHVMEDALIVQDDQKPDEPEPPKPDEAPSQTEIQLPEEFKVVSNDTKVEKLSIISADEDKVLPPANIPLGPVNNPGGTGGGEELSDEPFEVVEEQPEFIGGQDAFRKFLQNNLRYPERAADEGIQGRVMVRFIVERDGSVSAVEVAKGVDPDLDKEAVRVVKALPKWKPGRQQGKAVRTRYMLPIVFTLQ